MSRETMLVLRSVPGGAEDRFEQWARDADAALRRVDGHLGSVALIDAEDPTVRAIVVQFRDRSAARAWERSPERDRVVAAADRFSTVAEYRLGADVFTVDATSERGAPPDRFRLALLTWAMLVPLISLFAPLVARLGLWSVATTAVTAGLLVALMSGLLMPWATRVLSPWLHPHRPRRLHVGG